MRRPDPAPLCRGKQASSGRRVSRREWRRNVNRTDRACDDAASLGGEGRRRGDRQILGRKWPRVNAKAQKYGPTPLQEASINGNSAVAQLLLKSGAKPNFFTEVASGNMDAVKKQACRRSNDCNAPDGWDRPPLAYAAGTGHERSATLLLAAGHADFRPPSEDRTTLRDLVGCRAQKRADDSTSLQIGERPQFAERSHIQWRLDGRDPRIARRESESKPREH